MKKLLALLLCGSLAVSALTGCGSSSTEDKSTDTAADATEETAEDSTDAAADTVEATGEAGSLEGKNLVIGLSPTYQNFETTTDDGNGYEGLDIDILNALSAKCGFTYEISNMSFSSLIAAIQANQVDFVISGMCATDERKKAVDFSDGYLTEKLGILFRTEEGFTSAADLNGKTVSCANGENYETKIPKIEGANLTTFDNGAAAIQELIAGRTDAVMTDGASCKIRCEENPELSYFVMDASEIGEEPSQYAIAFPKGSEYLEPINAALDELKADGTIKEIVTNWLGAENAD